MHNRRTRPRGRQATLGNLRRCYRHMLAAPRGIARTGHGASDDHILVHVSCLAWKLPAMKAAGHLVRHPVTERTILPFLKKGGKTLA
jgi:xanthine dehydrogenase iron-sulfur cluster and FAD-binding subunit A